MRPAAFVAWYTNQIHGDTNRQEQVHLDLACQQSVNSELPSYSPLRRNRPVLNDASEADTCRTLITPKLLAEVDSLKRLQAETAAELDVLLPAILDKAFKEEM